MHQLWCWITTHAEAITAITTAVSAIITAAYLVATIRIFYQARRSADAAQTSATAAAEAAQAGKDNAVAAQRSADAAQASADAAKKNTELMALQIEQQELRRKVTLQAGVDAALTTVSVWKAQTGELANLNGLNSLPPTDNLTLPYTIVESAAPLDVKAALILASALNDMNLARGTIESTRHVDNKSGKNIGHFERAGKEAAGHLDAAASKLKEVSLALGKPSA